jgi:hypothetical protein
MSKIFLIYYISDKINDKINDIVASEIPDLTRLGRQGVFRMTMRDVAQRNEGYIVLLVAP